MGDYLMRKWLYILSGVTLLIFLALMVNYEHGAIVYLDGAITELLFGNNFISFFHYFGETKLIVGIALTCILYLWFKQRNYRGMLLVVLAVGMGNGLNQLMKNLIGRTRPDAVDQLTSFSFPSGHAMVGLLYLFIVAYIVTETVKNQKAAMMVWIFVIILVFLTGLSRITGNHHYASDVIAGWGLGFTWFMVCIYWYERRKRSANKIIN